MRLGNVVMGFVVAVVLGGCSLMAPQYSASIPNVQKLKNEGDYQARVGSFVSGGPEAHVASISIRGSSLASPYNASYADYLAEAIKQELLLAGKYNPGSEVEISGVLLKNDLDASGFSVAYGVMEARFVVKKAGVTRYDQVKSVRYQWESSFAGAIAIPRAQQEYPNLVQKLVSELVADPAFLKALK